MNRKLSPQRQIAYVVERLPDAVNYWTTAMRVGPFFVFEHVNYGGVTYHGRPTPIDASVALSAWGDIQIELIEQHNDAPSIYLDFLHSGGSGVQHVALYTDGYQEEVLEWTSRGFREIQAGGMGIGVSFCYLSPPQRKAPIVELIELTPEIARLNCALLKQAQAWDGSHPFRTANELLDLR